MTDEVEVTRNDDEGRFEARVDGALAGFAAFHETQHVIVFTHTEVDPAFEGRGVGAALARGALDAVRAQGTHEVKPLCPFIRAWIQRHPEYQDLVHHPGPPEPVG
ncbi:GNAT family N-acetyltransferase [Oryzobacter sp. R7]|uniref:GNAT family N-acetyltransferase n=1 Tax=Oryzobacter faecalis TaxID=3388656 RepID=UPI00398D5334